MIRRPHKARTISYGVLANASQELKNVYYAHGWLRDEDMPELPCIPMMEGEHVDPLEELHKKEIIALVQEVLETLGPRSIKVLQMRFGIGLTQDYTLEEVGMIFDLSRERIRQIEGKALRLMKHPVRANKLRRLFV